MADKQPKKTAKCKVKVITKPRVVITKRPGSLLKTKMLPRRHAMLNRKAQAKNNNSSMQSKPAEIARRMKIRCSIVLRTSKPARPNGNSRRLARGPSPLPGLSLSCHEQSVR